MKTILTNCTVIDCTGKPPVKDMTVVIEGDKVEAILAPSENISNIRKLKLVLKGGKMVETREPEELTDLWELLFF